jgi:maleylacetate reductase
MQDADQTPKHAAGNIHFIHDWPSSRVLFGHGILDRVADEASALGERIMLIADPSVAHAVEEVQASLGERLVARSDDVVMHVPSAVAEIATRTADDAKADVIVCVGGGSSTGLAKGVAKLSGRPILAVPSTYAGSEMTSIWGLTDGGRKVTGRLAAVRPKTVIYDVRLTCRLPVSLSITSGLNAVAHSAEALYSQMASPLSIAAAREGIQSMTTALSMIAEHGGDNQARALALRGAWLSGWALEVSSMGIHHKMCHVLGGLLDLPHSPLHAAFLPFAIAYNAKAAPEAMTNLVEALGVSNAPDDAGGALWDLNQRLGAPTSLASIGMSQGDISRAASAAVEELNGGSFVNPREIDEVSLAQLVHEAWRGLRPSGLPAHRGR